MERPEEPAFAPCEHKKREADPHSVCEACLRFRKIGFCTENDRCDECYKLTEVEFALFVAPRVANAKRNEAKKKNSPAKAPKKSPKMSPKPKPLETVQIVEVNPAFHITKMKQDFADREDMYNRQSVSTARRSPRDHPSPVFPQVVLGQTKRRVFKPDAPAPDTQSSPKVDTSVGTPCPDFPLVANIDDVFDELDRESEEEELASQPDLSELTQTDPVSAEPDESLSSQVFIQPIQRRSVVKPDLSVSKLTTGIHSLRDILSKSARLLYRLN